MVITSNLTQINNFEILDYCNDEDILVQTGQPYLQKDNLNSYDYEVETDEKIFKFPKSWVNYAYFMLNLICDYSFDQIVLRNIHNGEDRDYSTAQIR